jgi:hypothetical protein
MPNSVSESQIVRQILDYLAADHIFAFRLNTSATKIGNRFFRAHSLGPGASDILSFPVVSGFVHSNECLNHPVRHIQPTWIEVKTSTGKQSLEQKSFQEHVESLGHRYILARSVDDIRALWQERCQGAR